MNYHELHRFSIIQDVLNNKLKCREATSILGISYRHLSRIQKSRAQLRSETFISLWLYGGECTFRGICNDSVFLSSSWT